MAETDPDAAESSDEVVDVAVSAVTITPRGDCNADGGVDISDVIFLNAWLFQGGTPPQCVEACNANSDHAVDISDSIFILAHLFQGGAAPQGSVSCCADDTDCGHAERCGANDECESCTVNTALVAFEACDWRGRERVRIANNNDCNVDITAYGGCFYDTEDGGQDIHSTSVAECTSHNSASDVCLSGTDHIIRAGQSKAFRSAGDWEEDRMWREGELAGFKLVGPCPPLNGDEITCGESL